MLMTRRAFQLLFLPVALFCCIVLLPRAARRVEAQGSAVFGPETFTLVSKKANITRTFAVGDAFAPYTLTLTNGASDGSGRIKKGSVSLNGNLLFDSSVFNRRTSHLVVALHPGQQNELAISLRGGAGAFVTISVTPTASTVLNDPSNQEGVGFPASVAVDQTKNLAYVTDRYYHSLFKLDIASGNIVGRLDHLDGGSTPGGAGTFGVAIDANTATAVAVNEGEQGAGSLAVVNLSSGAVDVMPIVDGGNPVHPIFVALNPSDNIAAFNALFDAPSQRAYFMNRVSGALTTVQEQVTLNAVAANPVTNQFIFTAGDTNVRPSLIVYGAAPPFKRALNIASSAPAGTGFEKVAINTRTNMAVAVNQRDAAAYVYDLAAGTEIARIPITVGVLGDPAGDVAINPNTNMAAIISRYSNLVTIINLDTLLVTAELPLPAGVLPNGIDLDYQLNRAVIGENGLVSNKRNGTLFVIQLPEP